MEAKKNKITIELSNEEWNQLKNIAAEQKMTLAEYVKFMATLLCRKNIELESLKSNNKNGLLEKELLKISDSLEKQKRQIEMIQKSVYSAAWKIESHMRKIRTETTEELQKDVERINYLTNVDRDKDDNQP